MFYINLYKDEHGAFKVVLHNTKTPDKWSRVCEFFYFGEIRDTVEIHVRDHGPMYAIEAKDDTYINDPDYKRIIGNLNSNSGINFLFNADVYDVESCKDCSYAKNYCKCQECFGCGSIKASDCKCKPCIGCGSIVVSGNCGCYEEGVEESIQENNGDNKEEEEEQVLKTRNMSVK